MTSATKLQLDYQSYFKAGITYPEYLSKFQEEMDSQEKGPYAQYLPHNWKRQSRLDKKLKLTPEFTQALVNIKSPINWLVITEHWCGDASQINPVINKAAVESKGKINLRFVYRDTQSELMDAHLTDGRSRSIPIVIQLDKDYDLISTYGPRPAAAQDLVKTILAKNENYMLPLHSWYAKDKQKSIQNDLVQLLKQSSL